MRTDHGSSSLGQSAPSVRPDNTFERRIAFFESVLRTWLQRPGITVASGRWDRAGIAEFVLQGDASVLPSHYGDCFAGIREIRLHGVHHHLHVDLGRVHAVEYVIAPSVCFDFRPSFEVRFLVEGPGGRPTGDWTVALMLTEPYAQQSLRRGEAAWFIATMIGHLREAPDLVDVKVDPTSRAEDGLLPLFHAALSDPSRQLGDWHATLAMLRDVRQRISAGEGSPVIEPQCLNLIRDALRLRDGCLVIFRDQVLVEFQTEKISGLFRYEEAGHVSWQVGGTHEHHCHLSLAAVRQVLFSAEPVPCQGGRLNYTVWFLVDSDCGNPFRRGGYFSFVLNAPYQGKRVRREVIEPVFALYQCYAEKSWVAADDGFLRAMVDVPMVWQGPCPA